MLHDLVYILAAVTVLFTLLIRLVTVSGPSMTSTLLDRDYVAVLSNVLYRDVKNGDVVVAKVPGFEDEPIVKRVIATQGADGGHHLRRHRRRHSDRRRAGAEGAVYQ